MLPTLPSKKMGPSSVIIRSHPTLVSHGRLDLECASTALQSAACRPGILVPIRGEAAARLLFLAKAKAYHGAGLAMVSVSTSMMYPAEHVCEVQLHLDPIYKLKNDDGHKRYVTYRNQRAE